MIEIRYCNRIYNTPIKDVDFIIIDEQNIAMSYIDVPITEILDNFFEECINENDEVSEDITEDMLIDYMVKELLAQGYTREDFHIYKKVI